MEKEFKSFFKTVQGNEGERCHYATRLDTYGCGCSHDCSYCYAKSLLSFRNLWNPSEPCAADPEKVARVIDRKLKEGDIVRLGGMTDCFQYKEKERRVTYRAIEELNRKRVGYLIVTKSDLVASDEYLELMDKDLAHIQVSITTTDDELGKRYEKAPVISKRIRAIERLYREGYDVTLDYPRSSPNSSIWILSTEWSATRCWWSS